MIRLLLSMLILFVSGCVWARPERRDAIVKIPSANITEGRAFETYEPVPHEAATLLGCFTSPNLPVCRVTVPDAEEDSAFRAEAVRLLAHGDERCRNLGASIETNRHRVRMYPMAIIREGGNGRLYGVGHTYELGQEWMVRVARRLDDLNDRSLAEKTRTLRHEMSHTLGATELPGSGWTAEDYAQRCAETRKAAGLP